jgi:hypothetical protein
MEGDFCTSLVGNIAPLRSFDRLFILLSALTLPQCHCRFNIVFTGETKERDISNSEDTLSGSRGSSVSIVSDYGLDDRAIEVRSPAEAKGFFL